ncbi:hypothetical protein Rsub_02312 [Raphidocelis subcapitata]|uniref:MPN domain-containing protein n=1 Tax=Raphidocelis subcapitata TaxID=307507 RepID=A0A2V0NPQ8_9CHLO|nr:hypothetical protein Rsub_02312 [Raphidocelis subcapitata]|eukprot:GBF89594.1 hypothetical protein Rsub_02312 [Raphidocelis subcapitata]
MARSYSLGEDAALTILLHASKHPSCTVNGVLLGGRRGGGDGGGDGGGSGAGAYEITSAVPLFHRSHVIAPCVEIALTQAEIIAEQEGLSLLGYYHADYKFGPAELGPLARRIADRMADRQPATCVLLLDNERLAAFTGAAAAAAGGGGDADAGGGGGGGGGGGAGGPLDLLLREGGAKSWRRQQQGGGAAGAAVAVAGGGWGAVRKRYLNLFAAGRHLALVDFEEHLDDVGRDFLNAGLLAGSELLVR